MNKAAVCEYPILFSTTMVKAILEGRKTMTRRVVIPQPDSVRSSVFCKSGLETCHGYEIKCPYEIGMRLYVKENAWIWCKKVRDGLTLTGKPKYRYIPVGEHVVYQADHPGKPENRIDDNPDHDWRMKVARFMPKWASRITLELVSGRIERVKDITEDDAGAEGFRPILDRNGIVMVSARGCFHALWEELNFARGYGWDANPWVWVLEFRRTS